MSIIKYCQNPTHDSMGNPTLVNLSSSGMTKTAAYNNFGDEIKDYISGIQPKEGYAYLLIAAMGDQNWGPNRNSDYWPTEALKHAGQDYGHKTYETNGNWYHHHQNKDPNLSYGRVKKSVWNDDMGRIELIVEVDLKKDDKTRKALENNETIETSMGAKLRYDVCKVCHPNWKEFYKIPEEEMIAMSREHSLDKVHEIGKKYGVDLTYITKMNPDGGPVGIHSRITKYCEHMKTKRNQILPSGEQVCVVNLRPNFFDISYVSVNADKSSFVLAKVAEDNTSNQETEHPSEDIDDNDNDSPATPDKKKDKDNYIEKEVPDGKVIADNMDDIQRYYLDNICPYMHEREESIPDEVIDGLASEHDLPSIMSSMMAMGMMPHPREFQRIVMIQMGKRDELDQADQAGDFLRYSDIPEVDPYADIGEDVIGISPQCIHPGIMRKLKDFFWGRSGYRQPVVRRMVIIKKAAKNPYLGAHDAHHRQRSIAPALLASMGTLYAANALEGRKKLPQMMNEARGFIGNKKVLGAIGASIVAAMALNKMIQPRIYDPVLDREGYHKYAASNIWKATKLVGPTLGTFLWGGHIINKAQQGRDISKVEKFVAKNPVATSVGATLLANKPKIVPAAVKGVDAFRRYLFKGAELGVDYSYIDINDYPEGDRDALGVALWEHVHGIK